MNVGVFLDIIRVRSSFFLFLFLSGILVSHLSGWCQFCKVGYIEHYSAFFPIFDFYNIHSF